MYVSGIKGIKTIKSSRKLVMGVLNQDKIDKDAFAEFEFVVLEAEGSNLKACLSHPKIDATKTYSNDINEILNVLGI